MLKTQHLSFKMFALFFFCKSKNSFLNFYFESVGGETTQYVNYIMTILRQTKVCKGGTINISSKAKMVYCEYRVVLTGDYSQVYSRNLDY